MVGAEFAVDQRVLLAGADPGMQVVQPAGELLGDGGDPGFAAGGFGHVTQCAFEDEVFAGGAVRLDAEPQLLERAVGGGAVGVHDLQRLGQAPGDGVPLGRVAVVQGLQRSPGLVGDDGDIGREHLVAVVGQVDVERGHPERLEGVNGVQEPRHPVRGGERVPGILGTDRRAGIARGAHGRPKVLLVGPAVHDG